MAKDPMRPQRTLLLVNEEKLSARDQRSLTRAILQRFDKQLSRKMEVLFYRNEYGCWIELANGANGED